MKTLEQLKQEQADALDKLQREHALANLAPVPPRSVQLTTAGLGHWLSYRCADLWEALDLMRRFQPVAFYQFKKTFSRFGPAALNVGKDAGEEQGGPYVAKLDVSQGEGFGPSVYLAWFARIGEELCMIRAELEREGYGPSSWSQFGASFQAHSSGPDRMLDGNGHRYISGTFRQNGTLGALFDHVIKWGSGSRESAHYQYSIMCDSVQADESADWIDAGLRLENIADAMHGPRRRYRFDFNSDSMTGVIVRLADGKKSAPLSKEDSWKLYESSRYGYNREQLDAVGDAVEFGH
jgi:hypothetical protein